MKKDTEDRSQRVVFRSFLILFSILLFIKPAWSTVTVFSRSGNVWLGNKLVLRTRSSGNGTIVAQRLKQILLYGITAPQIWIDKSGRDYVLYAKTIPVIRATLQRARLNHTSPFWLARIWASRLKSALLYGSYLITPETFVVPYKDDKQLPVMGHYSGKLSIRIRNTQVVRLENKGFPYVLKGLNPGRTEIKISANHLAAFTNVYVKEWAGFIPGKISLSLTGKEIPREYLEKKVLKQINRLIPRKSDTRLSLSLPKALIPDLLNSGETSVFPVKAFIQGQGYLPVKGMLNFQIKDYPFTPFPAVNLLVSNNPEGFSGSGILFKRSFETGPARFFFHHQNKGDHLYRFDFLIKNRMEKPVKIQVLGGGAGPAFSEINVGEKAVYRFFSSYINGLGVIRKLNPGETMVLYTRVVPPKESVSGIYQITPFNHNVDLQVETRIQYNGKLNNKMLPREVKAKKPRGIFPNPTIYIKARYIIGKHYAFIHVGKRLSLMDPDSRKPDFGDYGAFYKIRISIFNPFPALKKAQVMFSPEGGPARGVFILDHKILKQTPIVQPFNSYPLITIKVKPLQKKVVDVETIPEGGSSYPVDLVAQP
ncbi:MAG: hypothetical protein M1421_01380 [Candidatus Eremiobacteraeota bacterium]|jgi:hypothetical protein|nr:hypothetical protein [Candidatus Eremiobacteraeota bacterium]MCL5055413.1 hypothetical protein [Bacillota bacterium]